MRSQLIIFLFLMPLLAQARFSPRIDGDERNLRRAWCVHGGYVQQDGLRFVEAGVGRINFITVGQPYERGLPLAGAAFTFGAQMGWGDTSMIIAPKLAIEGCAWIFGGRIAYGYYMQDKNTSGVISIEGGFCFLTYVSVYAGYNIVKGMQENPVINEGTTLSIGLNIPLGVRTAAPPKSPTHL
jgi:hypothetical protein